MTEIRKATAEDIPAMADMLSRAFHDDPIVDWVFRDEQIRPKYTRRFFAEMGSLSGDVGARGLLERHADAIMNNLIGHDVERWREALDDPQAKLHLYGKSRIRPGRKMGHITRLLPRS